MTDPDLGFRYDPAGSVPEDYLRIVERVYREDLAAVAEQVLSPDEQLAALRDAGIGLTPDEAATLREHGTAVDRTIKAFDEQGRWSTVTVADWASGERSLLDWRENLTAPISYATISNDPEHFAWFYHKTDDYELVDKADLEADVVALIESPDSNVPWEQAADYLARDEEPPAALAVARWDQVRGFLEDE